jgi:sporulation protein YlmC with PRC-barrel domain
MFLTHKQIVGLPVETKSGLLLGKIKSFKIDNETQTVLQYTVKSRSLIGKLLSERDQELIIHRNQVISINEEKMIVEDSAVKENVMEKAVQGVSQGVPA